ncbi:MAG: hypothetical protein WCK02_11040 [Bacteroidota bacterium]
MKKALITIICFLSLSSYSQKYQRIKDAKEITYFGLDFTKTKFRGLENYFQDLDKIKNTFFSEWNILIMQEKEKYNLEKAFNKEKVSLNVSKAIERNKERSMANIITIDEYSIPADDIKKIVKNYSIEGGDIGLVFVVESLDKIDQEVSIWITFFDIKTKEVLLSKLVTGKAGGIAFKNYWAGGIYQIIKQCPKQYKSWLKE